MSQEYMTAPGVDTDIRLIPLQNLETSFALEPFSVNSSLLAKRLLQKPLLDVQTDSCSSKDAVEERGDIKIKSWTPLMLRRWVLILFAITFLFLIIVLEIILKVSTDERGFGPTNLNLHYLWTYGPTAGKRVYSNLRFD